MPFSPMGSHRPRAQGQKTKRDSKDTMGFLLDDEKPPLLGAGFPLIGSGFACGVHFQRGAYIVLFCFQDDLRA